MKNVSLFLILMISLTVGLSCSKKEESLGPSANASGLPTYHEADFQRDKAQLEEKRREGTHLLGDLLARAEVFQSDLTFFEGLLQACDNMLRKYGSRFRFHGDSATSSRYLVNKKELIDYRARIAVLYDEIKKRYEQQDNIEEEENGDGEEALELLEQVANGLELHLETEEE